MFRQDGIFRLLSVGGSTIYGVVVGAALIASDPMAMRAAPAVTVGGPFALTAADGAAVTDRSFPGKWLLVYFGYISCPDTCPTTLVEIGKALAALAAEAVKLQPLFITVDPLRDTPEAMKKFMDSFDPRIVGLTGSPQRIAAVLREYGAYAARRIGSRPDDYAVDHSSYLYVIDPEGRFVHGFDAATPGDRIGAALRSLMDRFREERSVSGETAK
jgi:protein SCO1/2